jgi:hypothetical protein
MMQKPPAVVPRGSEYHKFWRCYCCRVNVDAVYMLFVDLGVPAGKRLLPGSREPRALHEKRCEQGTRAQSQESLGSKATAGHLTLACPLMM